MAGLLKGLGRIFTYKVPNNDEHGFELLEDETEGIGNDNKPNIQKDEQGQNSCDENKKTAKSKIKTKKNINTCKNNNSELQLSISNNVSSQLNSNLNIIKKYFDMPKNQDVIIREFKIGRKLKAFIVYIDGMIDKNTMNLVIFPQLMSKDALDDIDIKCPVDYLIDCILAIYSVNKERKFNDIILQILNGQSALFIEGCSDCILLETKGYEKRSVSKPVVESVVKGPQEGFTENLRTNITLVRKIIKNPKLVTEILPVGETNNSICAILYLEGVANNKVVEEVKKRIKKINTDFILGEGMVEQFIEDNSFMLFPQVMSTERPDRTASFIMEGQVVIITEGTPFAMAVPVTFFRLFHTSEDSLARWPFGSFLRLIRIFGLFCATLLPGLYVAAALYHPEMLPTELLASIAKAKEAVPFSTIIEVLIMEVSFELIREGGVRVPSVIGQTLGIVGALILGQAAITAGLVSPIVVIIVSITALGNFVIPNYSMALAVRIERFIFILLGSLLGFYGISLALFILMCSACSMKSFGVPFFTPVAPRTNINPDVVIRTPIWMQKKRPDGLNPPNRKRQGSNSNMWAAEKNENNNKSGDNEE